MLFEFKLTERIISDIIEKEFDDLHCVYSPMCDGCIEVFVNTNDVQSKLDSRIAYVTDDNAIEVYMEDVVQPNLELLDICGIPGINEIFYIQENGEWIVETNSDNASTSRFASCANNNLKKIMALPNVDELRTVSNNIWEIYDTLGVEATKQFLIDEFMSIMGGINECHAKLLVDRMTHGGSVASISRYTLKNDECGPMGKASFEESMGNFLNASAQGDVETTRGVSASIICGKRSRTGTGMMELKMDLSKCKI